MKKKIDGKTYELVTEKIEGTEITNINCYYCAAIGNINLCGALGMDCIKENGFYKEVNT